MPKYICFAECDTCTRLKDYKRMAADERAREFWSASLVQHRAAQRKDRDIYEGYWCAMARMCYSTLRNHLT